MEHYARTNDVAYAATKAGYVSTQSGTRALERSAVQDALDKAWKRLAEEGAEKAVTKLIHVLDTAPAGPTLMKAIDTTLKHTISNRDQAASDKELHEMTARELNDYLRRNESQRRLIETLTGTAVEIDPATGDPVAAAETEDPGIFG